MDKYNNTTSQDKKSIPKGLKLLQGPKRSEKFTVEYLTLCCESYPTGCGYEKECHRLYNLKDAQWGTARGWKELAPKRLTEEQRYANTLPTLSRRTVVSAIREKFYF